jgi:undecaprenyl-diphosphatase
VLIPVAVILTLGALLSGRMRLAIVVVAVLLVTVLFTDTVKDYVARSRPPDPLVLTSGYSFPSGHTLNGTATYGLVALVVWRARLALALRRAAVVAGVAIAALIGLSRIALGAHWPTDVLAGWLAGATLVAIAATLVSRTGAMTADLPWPPLRPRAPRRDPPRADRPTYSRAATVAGTAPLSRPRPSPRRRRRGRAHGG